MSPLYCFHFCPCSVHVHFMCWTLKIENTLSMLVYMACNCFLFICTAKQMNEGTALTLFLMYQFTIHYNYCHCYNRLVWPYVPTIEFLVTSFCAIYMRDAKSGKYQLGHCLLASAQHSANCPPGLPLPSVGACCDAKLPCTGITSLNKYFK